MLKGLDMLKFGRLTFLPFSFFAGEVVHSQVSALISAIIGLIMLVLTLILLILYRPEAMSDRTKRR